MSHQQAVSCISRRSDIHFLSLEKAGKEKVRKHGGASWQRKGVGRRGFQPEGTTSTKTLSTEEADPRTEDGHQRQRARTRRYHMGQGRWPEARSCRLLTGVGRNEEDVEEVWGFLLQKLMLFPGGEEVDRKETRYWRESIGLLTSAPH